MKTIGYRCDEPRRQALPGVAPSTGASVKNLFDNFGAHVIAERQAEARFVPLQTPGTPNCKMAGHSRRQNASAKTKNQHDI